MANVAVIGSQWGDEGKGKIVDWLSERADVIVRFQGGHNAGHTLVIDGKVFKLSLLPSGVVRPNKLSVIGNGVVVDPFHLLSEIAKIREQGVEITPETLMIAENVALILPLHQQIDKAAESTRGDKKIGTTGRGIGPAYEDKIARRAIRLCDLVDEDFLDERLDALLHHHNALRRGLGVEEADKAETKDALMKVRDELLSYSAPVWKVLDDMARQGKRILFEGAQGVMLDNDHGTYPYVTSSNTVTGSAFTGSGMGIGAIKTVLGITKAYTTRVGEGPFPTEQNNEIGELLGTRGHEWGTVTNRKRRCGWFDAVMVSQAIRTAGVTGIALTKLDVMDGMDVIKVCVGYEVNGEKYDYLPASPKLQAGITPIYEDMDGWSESTEGARSFKDLPANAVKYIRRLEELVGCPVSLVSTSPERDDTILMQDPFED